MLQAKKGFTLVEILISVAVMAIALGASFQATNYLFQMNELNENITPAMHAVEGMIDGIRNVPYDDIVSVYAGNSFTLNELDNRGVENIGVVYVNEIETDFLMKVKVVVCWRQRTRVIGEDQNLNGVLDGGEDENGNGQIDSPCSMETAIIYK
ncbi:MAG: prepilin-type N-terminal cleavage/methylation domain-containing protein [PVC group bacterium]|nr:prepilin-type N-terminal cleavage/methylation domain-containing protein [PVC group bacterium]